MQNKVEKKDWKVTLSYDVRHNDTYLITNQTEKDAIYIAENQNQSSECICIKEDESGDSIDTTIREVVWSNLPNSERKDWIDKEEKEKQKAQAKAKKEDLISRGLCLKCGEYIKHDERSMNIKG